MAFSHNKDFTGP